MNVTTTTAASRRAQDFNAEHPVGTGFAARLPDELREWVTMTVPAHVDAQARFRFDGTVEGVDQRFKRIRDGIGYFA